jgi:hypothetical protein
MRIYSNYLHAITDFHDRGFCNDFVLFGDNLFCVQERLFIRADSFSIAECHQLAHPFGENEDLVIFGIVVSYQNIKGILMNHYSFNSPFPKVITRKLNEMRC